MRLSHEFGGWLTMLSRFQPQPLADSFVTIAGNKLLTNRLTVIPVVVEAIAGMRNSSAKLAIYYETDAMFGGKNE